MPAETLLVGPTQVRIGDTILRPPVANLTATDTGKMLHLADGATLHLPYGRKILVTRQTPGPGKPLTLPSPGRDSPAAKAATQHRRRPRPEELPPVHELLAELVRTMPRADLPTDARMRHCGGLMLPKQVLGGGVLYACRICPHIATAPRHA